MTRQIDYDDPFAGLDGDLNEGQHARLARDTTDQPRYACEHCAGSGKWSGGRNRHGNSKCHACNGRGYFLSAAADRAKARKQRRTSKSSKLATAQDAIMEQEPGLIEELLGMTSWNQFAESLIGQFNTRGHLSDKQIAAARKMITKTKQSQATRKAARAASAVAVDLTPIREMFESAATSGLKRPTYRAEGLIISRAPAHGRNAGALYVKTADGDYQGKITPEQLFHASSDAETATKDALLAIAEDPEAAAVRYGRLTGSCACCGRELTAAESVQRGIGPICAAKYGF